MTQNDGSVSQIETRTEGSNVDNTEFSADMRVSIGTRRPLESVSEMGGAIKALELVTSFSKTMGAVQLYRVKQLYASANPPAELIDLYGVDFKAFCHNVGIPRSEAYRRTNDIEQIGQEMLSRAEALDVPLTTLRQVKSLPAEQKQQVHKFLMSGEADRESVKEYIAVLQSENARLDKLSGRERHELAAQVETLAAQVAQDGRVIGELKKEKAIRAKMLKERENSFQADQLIVDLQALRARYHTLQDIADPAIRDTLSAFRDVLADFHGERR